MTIYYLCLEPLENRYTKQWYIWFKEVAKEEGIDLEYIEGEVTYSQTDSKNFLDFRHTFIYKFSQLKKLFEKEIKDEDVIFVADGEYPGLEALEYYRRFYDKKFKIVTIWHAGTYDYTDLTYQKGLEYIGKNIEEVIFAISDAIFVATEFHKNLIVRNRIVDKDKIYVTGLPADVERLNQLYSNLEKDGDIVFAGRLTWEKGIDVIERLEKRYKIVKTSERPRPKEEYYQLLARSKLLLSPARQETFGYSVVEAMAMNTPVLVYDGLSYVEYVPKELRVPSYFIEDWIEKIEKYAGKKMNLAQYVMKYDYKRVIKTMYYIIENKI